MTDPRYPGATILPFEGKVPTIHETAFVAPGARIIGDVTIGAGASVWYNCVLRGDIQRIVIGARTNVQDGSVFHVEGTRADTVGCATIVGEDCVIGHMALVHAATLEDGAFVGMGAIAMDESRIAAGAMLGAGALLTPGKTIPPGEIWIGRPAARFRRIGAAQAEAIRQQAARYCDLAQRHRAALDGASEA